MDDDFNGDGYADLATISGGPLRIIYGSHLGVQVSREAVQANQVFDLTSPGLPAHLPAGLTLGGLLVSADFNHDCRADLVIPVSHDESSRVGLVVLYGGRDGLSTVGSAYLELLQLLPEVTVLRPYQIADHARGDFDGDGYDDLVLGVHWISPLIVLYGSDRGLTSHRRQLITRGSLRAPPGITLGSLWRSALTAADFTGDGRDELVVGQSTADMGEVENVGVVVLMPGSAAGLRTDGLTFIHQDTVGVPGTSKRWDYFGDSVVAGDLTGDGRPELIVSSPREGAGRRANGRITVLLCTTAGLTTAGAQAWNRDTPGVLDIRGPVRRFGGRVELGDLNGDGRLDLVVGMPEESVGTGRDEIRGAGAVLVLYGAESGLTSRGVQLLNQRSPSVREDPETDDHFGWGVKVARVGPGSAASLIISSPTRGTGNIYVLRGTPNGVTPEPAQLVRPGSITPPGLAAPSAWYEHTFT